MSYIGRVPRGGGEFKKVDSIKALQDGSRVTFPLTITNNQVSYTLDAGAPQSLIVVKDGAPLEPSIDFNVADGNITFTALQTPTVSSNVFIISLAEPINIGTPGDGVVLDRHFAFESVKYDNLTAQAKDKIICNIIAFGL